MSPQRAALVTGAGGGIGAATTRRFLEDGWSVAGCDLAPERIGAGVRALAADVRSVADCDRCVAETLASFGRLDALVNAAGVWREGDTRRFTEQDYDLVLDVNLKGTFFMCRAAIAPLEATRGCIVNLSSDAGLQGNTGAAAYCASKGGVSILTKALALELAPREVRVNAVCPCDVATPMLEFQANTYGGGDPDGYYKKLLATYPQGRAARFARPEEIAEMVFYLCQSLAAPITGACLPIDFGLSAGK